MFKFLKCNYNTNFLSICKKVFVSLHSQFLQFCNNANISLINFKHNYVKHKSFRELFTTVKLKTILLLLILTSAIIKLTADLAEKKMSSDMTV